MAQYRQAGRPNSAENGDWAKADLLLPYMYIIGVRIINHSTVQQKRKQIQARD